MKIPKARQLNNGRWFMRLRLNGSEQTRTFDTEKEAETWALAVKADFRLNGTKDRLPAENKTIAQLIDEYTRMNDLSPATLESYRQTKNRFRQLMNKPYNKVHNWQQVYSMETGSPNTVNLFWSKIRTALRFHGLDVPTIKMKKAPSKRKNYLDEEEVRTFCDHVRGHKYETYFLLMLSSLRVSEALGEIDVLDDGIHVHGTKTEAADRFVPYMIPRLKEIINDRPKTTSQSLNNALKKISEECDFDELSCHSLRISFASLCYSKNIPERVCMKIGGWTDINTMHRVYVRISEDDVRRYADIMKDVF